MDRTNHRSLSALLTFIICIILFLFCCFIFFTLSYDSNASPKPLILMVVTITICCFIINSKLLKMPLLCTINLYILLIGLFHLGAILLWTLNLSDLSFWIRASSDNDIIKALKLFGLSICSIEFGILFLFSALFYSQKGNNNSRFFNFKKIAFQLNKRRIFSIGSLLFCIGLVLFIFNIYSVGASKFFSGGYDCSVYGENDARFVATGFWFLPLTLMIMLVGSSSRKRERVVLGLAVIYTLSILWIGHRMFSLLFFVLFVIAWSYLKYKISFKTTAICFFIILWIIPFTRLFRSYDRLEISPAKLYYYASSTSVLDGLHEMGDSVLPLIYIVKLVPDEINFAYGKEYIKNIRRIVPNVGLSKREVKYDSRTIPQVISDVINRGHTEAGRGFSCIADVYYNFGSIGVWIIFTFIGIVFAFSEKKMENNRNDLLFFLYHMNFCFCLMYAVRNGTGLFFRYIVWGSVMIYFIGKLAKKRGKHFQDSIKCGNSSKSNNLYQLSAH